MDYIKIRFGNLNEITSRFEKTIEEMFHSVSPMFSLAERAWKPPMDIYETPQTITILAEIAGVNKEDVEIELSSKAIRIAGRRSGRPEAENARYRLAEIQSGYFERILFLPDYIDPEAVSATYSNGFLKIELKKMPAEKTHRIEVSEG